jgi:hypothetical protein
MTFTTEDGGFGRVLSSGKTSLGSAPGNVQAVVVASWFSSETVDGMSMLVILAAPSGRSRGGVAEE